MILFYKSQIKENGVWCDDDTFTPLAVGDKNAQKLIETMQLDDNSRLIRIGEHEATHNCHGKILWLILETNGEWAGIENPVDFGSYSQ